MRVRTRQRWLDTTARLAVAAFLVAVGSTNKATQAATSLATSLATPPTTTPAPTVAAGPVVPQPTSVPPAARAWTVAFGGDSLLTRRIGPSANPFARIRPSLSEADLSIVNVETVISTRGRAEDKEFTFRSIERFPALLAAAGVDVGSLANNHARDFGPDALLDTIDALRTAGVEPIGAGADIAAAFQPAEFVVAGQRVAILGASQIIPPGAWPATAQRPGIASAGKHTIDENSENLARAVRAARSSHDVVLVVMHWGIEGDPCPSEPQRELGRMLRAAGATAVLGAHPHVLQPVAVDDTNGHGLIAYSLGNFIWDPRSGATADTAELVLQFNGSLLVGHAVHPHVLDRNGWAAAVDPASPVGARVMARASRRCPGAIGSVRS